MRSSYRSRRGGRRDETSSFITSTSFVRVQVGDIEILAVLLAHCAVQSDQETMFRGVGWCLGPRGKSEFDEVFQSSSDVSDFF